MFQNTKLFILIYLLFFVIVISSFMHYKNRKNNPAMQNTKNVLALVGEHPISIGDYLLQKEKLSPYLDSTNRQNKDYILKLLTDNMILLQEAERLKLNYKKSFLNDIEFFWHQSLIGELLKTKTQAVKHNIRITEEEIKAYYKALKNEYYFRYIELMDLNPGFDISNDKYYEKFIKDQKDSIDYDSGFSWVNVSTIDPQFKHLLLNNQPELNKWSFLNAHDISYLCMFKKIRKNPVSDYDNMKNEIEIFVREEKERDLIEIWMNNLRKNTKITINTDLLDKL